MNTINVRLYDFAKQELKLSYIKAREFVQIIDEAIQEDIKKSSNEYKGIVKDYFYKIDIKIEQLRSKLKDSKTDVVKWVAAIILGQTTLIITLPKLLAK